MMGASVEGAVRRFKAEASTLAPPMLAAMAEADKAAAVTKATRRVFRVFLFIAFLS